MDLQAIKDGVQHFNKAHQVQQLQLQQIADAQGQLNALVAGLPAAGGMPTMGMQTMEAGMAFETFESNWKSTLKRFTRVMGETEKNCVSPSKKSRTCKSG